MATARPAESKVASLENVGLRVAGHGAILSDIFLQIAAGETIALNGPSGSGKTSLLMLISGLERPSQGTIRINGHDMNSGNEDQRAQLRLAMMGIVFQSFHLLKSMTAIENVMLPLELTHHPSPRSEAADLLSRVGLGSRLDHFPNQLSGGEQQRVALARAVITRPSLLLADEPTGNLDSENGQIVLDLMLGLCANYQSALVLITHDHHLSQRCSRIVKLKDGRIVDDG